MLAIGAVGFDLGVQTALIAHQTMVYGIEPRARSRLNAVLLVGMFVGMTAGAALGSALLARRGWTAVTGMATLSALAAFAYASGGCRRMRNRSREYDLEAG